VIREHVYVVDRVTTDGLLMFSESYRYLTSIISILNLRWSVYIFSGTSFEMYQSENSYLFMVGSTIA